MSWQVVNLPRLTPSSSGSTVTNGIGSLDDAESITIFMVSTANGGSSGATGLTLQISQFDPAIPAPFGVTQSTGWNSISTTLFSTAATGQMTSSGSAFTLTGISYRGIRFSGLTSAPLADVTAYASKSIFV